MQTIPACMDISVTVALNTGDAANLGMHPQSLATLATFFVMVRDWGISVGACVSLKKRKNGKFIHQNQKYLEESVSEFQSQNS